MPSSRHIVVQLPLPLVALLLVFVLPGKAAFLSVLTERMVVHAGNSSMDRLRYAEMQHIHQLHLSLLPGTYETNTAATQPEQTTRHASVSVESTGGVDCTRYAAMQHQHDLLLSLLPGTYTSSKALASSAALANRGGSTACRHASNIGRSLLDLKRLHGGHSRRTLARQPQQQRGLRPVPVQPDIMLQQQQQQ